MNDIDDRNDMNSNSSQPSVSPPPTQTGDSGPVFRNRTWPVRFLKYPDGQLQMFYHEEWLEYQAQQEARKRAEAETQSAARAAREAELAAGRPPAPPESPADAIQPALARLSSYLSHPSSSASPPDLERHSRFCSICSHPDRDAIEADFIRWVSPLRIAEDYGISHRSVIYRHAHAVGLFQRRSNEVARIMERYLELVDLCYPDHPDKLDFDTVTRAVRVYAHLSPGHWFEPTRTLRVIQGGPQADPGYPVPPPPPEKPVGDASPPQPPPKPPGGENLPETRER